MTYEQALKFPQKWTVEQAVNDLERYLLREELPAMKAVAVCMKAAKKQIPKKPIIFTKGDLIGGYCPSCGAIKSYGDLSWHKIFNKHCNKCGQALDWSDKK